MPTIYLAGPEVFLPDALAVMAEKRRLARQFGFEPTGPGSDENQTPVKRTAAEIYLRNDDAMRRADVCLANITPFRGVSADAGTVYEIGFMIALGKQSSPIPTTRTITGFASAPNGMRARRSTRRPAARAGRMAWRSKTTAWPIT